MPMLKASKDKPKSGKWANRKAPDLLNDIGSQLETGQHTGSGELKWLSLSEVYPDPSQPRTILSKLGINRETIAAHLSGKAPFETHTNPHTIEKFLSLKTLAGTIGEHGLIQPIVVYPSPSGRGYLIEAGERRFLAHLLLKKQEIHALVRAPETRQQRKLQRQLVENVGREELSLSERVDALIKLETHNNESGLKPMGSDELSMLIGFSERQARKYLRLIRGPEDIVLAVRDGRLSSLDEAARLSNIENKRAREEALQDVLTPKKVVIQTEKQTEAVTPAQSTSNQKPSADKSKKTTKADTTAIDLGVSKNAKTIKHLMGLAVGEEKFLAEYADVDWDDMGAVKKTWRRFWAELEKSS